MFVPNIPLNINTQKKKIFPPGNKTRQLGRSTILSCSSNTEDQSNTMTTVHWQTLSFGNQLFWETNLRARLRIQAYSHLTTKSRVGSTSSCGALKRKFGVSGVPEVLHTRPLREEEGCFDSRFTMTQVQGIDRYNIPKKVQIFSTIIARIPSLLRSLTNRTVVYWELEQ